MYPAILNNIVNFLKNHRKEIFIIMLIALTIILLIATTSCSCSDTYKDFGSGGSKPGSTEGNDYVVALLNIL